MPEIIAGLHLFAMESMLYGSLLKMLLTSCA